MNCIEQSLKNDDMFVDSPGSCSDKNTIQTSPPEISTRFLSNISHTILAAVEYVHDPLGWPHNDGLCDNAPNSFDAAVYLGAVEAVRVELITDPPQHLAVPRMGLVRNHLQQIPVSTGTSTVLRRASTLSCSASRDRWLR